MHQHSIREIRSHQRQWNNNGQGIKTQLYLEREAEFMQKQVLRKTITLRQRKCIKTKFTRNNEQGIALVMALLMGVALMGGATALMVRMLGARKVSASES